MGGGTYHDGWKLNTAAFFYSDPIEVMCNYQWPAEEMSVNQKGNDGIQRRKKNQDRDQKWVYLFYHSFYETFKFIISLRLQIQNCNEIGSKLRKELSFMVWPPGKSYTPDYL